MASYNRVIVIGNLTRDPELKRTPSGAAVCEIRLAVSESYRNKEGERIERPVYVDVVVWNQQAEACNQYLSKGSPLFVEGRLQYDEWKTPQGDTRSKLRIVASRTQFLGGHQGQSQSHDSSGQPAGNASATEVVPQGSDESDTEPEDDETIPF